MLKINFLKRKRLRKRKVPLESAVNYLRMVVIHSGARYLKGETLLEALVATLRFPMLVTAFARGTHK